MEEPLPLSTLHRAILKLLQNRDDVVLFGAQAVNAYVKEPRMTQNIDIISNRAALLAEELHQALHQQFHIALRVREVAQAQGYRLYQVQKLGNRHLVDIRQMDILPSAQRLAQILVLSPAELIAYKVIAYHQRRGQPKAGTDWRDIAMLLLTFPELKEFDGSVKNYLSSTSPTILATWQEVVQQMIQPIDDDEF